MTLALVLLATPMAFARGDDRVEAPRGDDRVEAPRTVDIQAPRG